MTCPSCNGEVDVACYNGARLRCGCGKTIVDAPPVALGPMADPLAKLRALAQALAEHRVSSYSADGMTLVMHPDSWSPRGLPPSVSTTAPPEPTHECPCGHNLVTEHNETGCVQGCLIEVCEAGIEARS